MKNAARGFARVAVVAGALFAPAMRAQFWQKDAAFAPVLASPEIPLEQKFTAVARQSDGKLVVAGYVERVNGQTRPIPQPTPLQCEWLCRCFLPSQWNRDRIVSPTERQDRRLRRGAL